MDTWNRRPDQRIDALFHEAHMLFEIHNALLLSNALAWEVTQTELAEYLGFGERTVQRITERLQKMGRLNRVEGQGQASYIYSLPEGAIVETLLDVITKSNLFIVHESNGCIHLIKSFEKFRKIPIPDDYTDSWRD